MSRQLSLFNYMAKKACIEIQDEDEATICSANERVQSSQSMETNHEGTNETETFQSIPTTCSVDIALTSMSSPCQPTNVTFPKRAYSDKGRSFNPAWYQQYSWLEYSVKKDAAFCFPCRLFGSGSIALGRPETVNGFRDWKHATGNKGALLSHNNSYTHTQSVVAWEQFKATSSSGTVVEQLGNDRSERNRHYFHPISDVLLTCCKQDIALRGHRETDDSLNRGNFLEIYLFSPSMTLLLLISFIKVLEMLSIHRIIYKIPLLASWGA